MRDNRSLRRSLGAVALAAVLLAACGGDRGGGALGTPSTAVSSTDPKAGAPVKVADALTQAAAAVNSARARRVGDLTSLSNDIVHVRADGAIEVSLHTAAVVGADQLADLRRLGGDVVTSVTTPSVPGSPPGSVVQVWVPADRLNDVAALPWVASVTAPSYARGGG